MTDPAPQTTVPIHLLRHVVPTPKQEKTMCGLSIAVVQYTLDPEETTCPTCREEASRAA